MIPAAPSVGLVNSEVVAQLEPGRVDVPQFTLHFSKDNVWNSPVSFLYILHSIFRSNHCQEYPGDTVDTLVGGRF